MQQCGTATDTLDNPRRADHVNNALPSSEHSAGTAAPTTACPTTRLPSPPLHAHHPIPTTCYRRGTAAHYGKTAFTRSQARLAIALLLQHTLPSLAVPVTAPLLPTSMATLPCILPPHWQWDRHLGPFFYTPFALHCPLSTTCAALHFTLLPHMSTSLRLYGHGPQACKLSNNCMVPHPPAALLRAQHLPTRISFCWQAASISPPPHRLLPSLPRTPRGAC